MRTAERRKPLELLRVTLLIVLASCGGGGGGGSAGTSEPVIGQQFAYVKASNPGTNDLFGAALAVSTDGNTMAVGAFGEASNAQGVGGDQTNNSAANAGAVYVFTRNGTTWTQQAYIKASNAEAGDTFGRSVALSADGSTLAVGADGEDSVAQTINGSQTDNTASGAGAVYVFSRNNAGVWSQQAYIKGSDVVAGNFFGTSVALSADGNTLAAGPLGGTEVYVFTRSGTTWTEQARFGGSNTQTGDGFGDAVALSSDGNTLAVAASFEASNGSSQADNSAPGAGAAYVFTRSGTTWTQQAYIKASNAGQGDAFGNSVSLSSDGNTLAVGAPNEGSNATGVNGNGADNSATGAGAAYVFTRSGTTWTQQAYVKPSNTEFLQEYGISVALSGDGNVLSVGSDVENHTSSGINGDQTIGGSGGVGAVYMYQRSGTAWTQNVYVKASNPQGQDFFGVRVALSGDGATLAVGANGEASANNSQNDNTAPKAGAVYVFD